MTNRRQFLHAMAATAAAPFVLDPRTPAASLLAIPGADELLAATPSRVEHVEGLSLRNVRVEGRPSDAADIRARREDSSPQKK